MAMKQISSWVGVFLAIGVAAMAADVPPHATPTSAAPLKTAANAIKVPEGFRVSLFAGEPDVRQPISFTIDPRGRLWVAENFSYPSWLQAPTEKDRIVILEDSNGDGTFDKRSIFWAEGNNVTSVALGFGGAFVAATPNLLFIPDRNGDDVPDGPPEILLDGWDVKAQHNLFNALTWGPDGWLYGCNGIMSNSRVGKPGTPDGQRTPINCGVWRYHPTRKVFEAVAHGTTNPWGLDFDDHGEMFITNCVIPHLFYVVPGARLQRMFGSDFAPHSYGLIDSCADHVHWDTVEAWSDIRSLGVTSTTDRAGGGHAHAGAMIYLADNWPARYRNSLLTCNIHGHRVNNDRLERKGSGYVARHEPDFLRSSDPWFRGMELRYGPDGAVYLTDWSDVGECHETDGDHAHRENGRIFKVSFGETKPVRVDLASLDSLALAKLQTHPNDWYVRNSRRLLQERASNGLDLKSAHAELVRMFQSDLKTPQRLRAFWALQVSEGMDATSLLKTLHDSSEDVRVWAIRFLCEDKRPDDAARREFAKLGKDDPSPRVRLALASALQRMPIPERWELAGALSAHPEDAGDGYLPLMNWYGIEPLAAAEPSRAVTLLNTVQIPLVRKYLARRLLQVDGGGALLVTFLEGSSQASARVDVLLGMAEALVGRKGSVAPPGWDRLYERLAKDHDASTRKQATLLGLRFRDPRAAALLRSNMMDRTVSVAERREALQALADNHVSAVTPDLFQILDDPDLRRDALKALAAFVEPKTSKVLLERYARLTPEEREDAVATLASRPAWASALLDAMARGQVPPRDLPVSTARQIAAFSNPALAKKLENAWGTIRSTSQAKASLLAKYKILLKPERLQVADRAQGRQTFQRTCGGCHKLYDAGNDVGPNLSGSDRGNLDYILENVLDPNATVGRDFKLQTVATVDGRLISGILRSQDEKTVTIQTVNEKLVLDRSEVEAIKSSDASMMPEGLLESLSETEILNLVAYLASKSQVALPTPSGAN